MSTITPHYRTVQQLLQSQSFSIDEYQREYKWQKENIDELLTDLYDKFQKSYRDGDETKKAAGYEDYFLGSIIVSKRNGKSYLVDGQQRVTSLTLLLIYLYRAAKSNPPPAAPNLAASLAPLIFSDNFGSPRFNLDIVERLPVIDALFHGQPFTPDGKDESIQTMYARYHDIEERDLAGELGVALPHFAYWLMAKVGLIEIASDSDEHASAIFETMNDRGKPLSPVDMLKAYLLAPVEDEAQRRAANQIWKQQVLALISWRGRTNPSATPTASRRGSAPSTPRRSATARRARRTRTGSASAPRSTAGRETTRSPGTREPPSRTSPGSTSTCRSSPGPTCGSSTRAARTPQASSRSSTTPTTSSPGRTRCCWRRCAAPTTTRSSGASSRRPRPTSTSG
jgi:hypothetical protein